MLIACTGPNTWHAKERANELARAFKEKHDPTGFSTEILGETTIEEILKRLSTPSFFATKRFLRCDGILKDWKIADIRILLKKLAEDKDGTIVVTFEQDEPKETVLNECKAAGSFFHYPYPLLTGQKFVDWCIARGAALQVPKESIARVVESCMSDVWRAEQELQKCSAYHDAPIPHALLGEDSIFTAIDTFLTDRDDWRAWLDRQDAGEFFSILPMQTKALLRVKDHATRGMKPFIAQKLARVRSKLEKEKHLRALSSIFATRSGLATDHETDTIL